MLNKVMIIGNLGADPEVRHSKSGDPIVNLSIATTEKWKDKSSGEQKKQTEWHRVVIFGRTAEVAEQYLRKGSKVYIEGKSKTRKWTDKSGSDKYTTEIVLSGFDGKLVMIDGKKESPGNYEPVQKAEPELDDSIPF